MSETSLALGQREAAEQDKRHADVWSAFQGVVVVVGGLTVICFLAFSAMSSLVGPNGWITRAANTAYAGTVAGEP